MLHKIPTLNMTREAWLAERRHSLGGSDMGAVLGLNRWASPLSVWAEKTGRTPPEADSEAMRQGRDLEDYVARRFTERSGLRVQRENYLLRSDAAPHLHANIDRRVTGRSAGLECKTASALNQRAFAGGDFSESYYAQCVTYLAVTGWERWYLAVLVLGREFKVYQMTTIPGEAAPGWCESSVYVSPEELAALQAAAKTFWETYVATDTQPPADGSAASLETLQAIFRQDDGSEVQLFGRERLLEEWADLSGQKKAIEQAMDAIKQTIMEDMGTASTAGCPGWRVTWKTQERRSFDAAAFHRDHPGIALDDYYKTTAARPMRITKERTA